MSRARHGTGDARFAALLAAGALTLHQLRYLIADGDSAPAALRHDGHAYLSAALIPILVFAGALLFGSLVRAAVASPRVRERSLNDYAISFAAGMVAIFVCQETLEGVLASGHASGLTAAFAAGGWVAIPLAALLALPLALLARLLDRVEARIASTFRTRRTLLRAPGGASRSGLDPGGRALEICNLAFGFARRPPPASTH